VNPAGPWLRLGSIDFGARRFEVVLHDLLHEKVDGIVNAANGALAHGGGVAAAIARAAGAELEQHGERIIARRGALQPGEAVLTTAGKLPFKGVIHAVGLRQGQGDEENTPGARAHQRVYRRGRARLEVARFSGDQLGYLRSAGERLRAGVFKGGEGFF
jgi:O-acetyl-ADP-ribose deacetylase (regulator of RNase III)